MKILCLTIKLIKINNFCIKIYRIIIVKDLIKIHMIVILAKYNKK